LGFGSLEPVAGVPVEDLLQALITDNNMMPAATFRKARFFGRTDWVRIDIKVFFRV
jgi:hypothetical protein